MHAWGHLQTSLSQPPKKRSKLNFTPASESVIVSPNDTTILPQPESAAMPKTSANMSSRQQQGKGAEDQLAVGDTPPGDKSTAALTEPSSQFTGKKQYQYTIQPSQQNTNSGCSFCEDSFINH